MAGIPYGTGYMSPYPTNYTGYIPNTAVGSYPQVQPQQPQNNGIIWVQGEAGAKSYLVGAGQSVLLMDSENSSFYIKSTDASGMPQPLRVFDYTERVAQAKQVEQVPAIDMSDYITRDEFQKFSDKLKAMIRKEIKDGRESSV